MKTFIIITALLFTCTLFSQNIEGHWRWSYNEKHSSTITLEQVNSNEYRGSYCSVYYQGRRIDCSDNDEEYNLSLAKVSNNIFEGTFKNNFSNKPNTPNSGTIRITYIPSTQKIKIEILTEPEGEFYLPNNVLFKK